MCLNSTIHGWVFFKKNQQFITQDAMVEHGNYTAELLN